MRARSDTGTGYERSICECGKQHRALSAQCQRKGQRKEGAAPSPDENEQFAVTFVTDDKGGSEDLRSAKLDDVPGPRTAKSSLNTPIYDHAGPNDQGKQQVNDFLAIDSAQVSFRVPVVEIEANNQEHGQAEKVTDTVLDPRIPWPGKIEAVVKKHSRDARSIPGNFTNRSDEIRKQVKNQLRMPKFQVSH
jgi:hypothetical protein